MKRILPSFLVLVFASSTLLAAPPSPKLKDFQYFGGHWTCKGTAFAFMGLPEHKTIATIDATWTLDKYWFQVHYKEPKTAANATPVEVLYLWGWDEQGKKFASGGFDNGGGHFIQSSSGWEGDKLVFEGDMHMGATTMKFHDVFTKVNASTVMHKGEAVIDGKWTKLDEETCTK